MVVLRKSKRGCLTGLAPFAFPLFFYLSLTAGPPNEFTSRVFSLKSFRERRGKGGGQHACSNKQTTRACGGVSSAVIATAWR
ncbi:hypothetical protein DXT99_26575 [Pontibacter diazotrophicus]|uniref:Uncharacterized protein n=1 Tax=Pontibacter diazotrophicus TaxID=1400979 RepID=A0A3D8KZ45_9BACT|nr:hypothetical protein DXT99_26575 [Pontibacter diazotrophicus]